MNFLKIAVLNNSGNVGKSMICELLFQPRIPNSQIIKIETINDDGTDDVKISAKDTSTVRDLIDTTDIAIIDVGASNIEAFINSFKKMDDIINDIDFFFIPTTPKPKQLKDTIKTITDLMFMGVSSERIKIIFNMRDEDFSLEKQYSSIFSSPFIAELNLEQSCNQFIIPETELFDLADEAHLNYKEVINDTRDFKALIRATKDREERSFLSIQRTIHSLFKNFDRNLDLAFNSIAKNCNWNFNKDN